MSGYEQLFMFTMNVDPITATCCMDGCPARASPVEPWMAALIPAGEYVVQVAGHPLVLRPMPGRQADIQRGHEYYHYMIGGRLYAGTFVGRDTAMYDAVLMDLFNALSDEQKAELHCTGFSELDSMMAQWLV